MILHIVGILFGIIVGTIRRGSIFRLNNLRWIWLAILPLVQVLLMKFYPAMPLMLNAVVTTLSYLCIVGFVIANRKYKIPAVLLGLGTLCNYIVIAANSFRMPISPTALSIYSTMTPEAVIAQRAVYFVATDGANFLFLGDVIYMPLKILGGFMSVGDILLAAGMFLLIVQVMGKNCLPSKKTTEKSN